MLADLILSGRALNEPPELPSIQEVEDFYGDVFEGQSIEDSEEVQPKWAANTFQPITPNDVEKAMANWKVSAPGPDGLTVQQAKNVPVRYWSIVMSAILFRNTHPSCWKLLRTVLVPKDGDRRSPTN